VPIFATPSADRFFDIPIDADLPPGSFVIADLRRQERSVDEAALAPYAVDEATAKERAMAEARRLKERTDALRGQVDRVRDTIGAAAAQVREALETGPIAPPPALDPAALTATLLTTLGPVKDALATALDEERAATPEGQAELATIAARIRDAGGPDWTADPAGIPARLKAVLGDPELLSGLGRLRDALVKGDGGGGE
jgi:hypothetical protein